MLVGLGGKVVWWPYDGVLEIPVFLHEGYEANVQISGAVGERERFPLKAGGAKDVVLR